ncbi:MAG: hypothetical protein MR878_04595 [Campylobacter sp.]|uniref:hypothetical protein n=1 Tax=Campylobacter sp. TaxID=205 RepID=UPI002AA7C2DA|nr:hypothetical protein [Campylobacter sp.]MCI7014649.1 hypothetical protein [Campylobacter sp.]
MAEAAFMKTQQLLPFLLSSFGSLFIAAQVGLIVFCHYQKENKIALRELKRFFIAIFFLLICLIAFGLIAWRQQEDIFFDPMKEAIITTKIAVSLFIAVNLCYMYYKFISAKKAFSKNESIEIRENIVLIAYYFAPLNIVLSILSIYLGIALRDF